MIQLGERCVHDIKVNMVTWTIPPKKWIKINIDGSALSNPSKIGAGGILRDQTGRLLMDFE